MNREILRFLNHQRSKVTSGQRRIIIIKIIISSAISMRTILSKVILERVSEGWRKKQGEGGGGGERHGRDDRLFVERQNDPRNWVTRHVDRISCGVFHCGSQKRARKRRSLAPLTILWIVRALASSHSSSSL